MINGYDYFTSRLSSYPQIEGFSGSYDIPPNDYSMSLRYFLKNQNADDAVQMGCVLVENHFLDLLETNFIKGRNFDPYKSSDSSKEWSNLTNDWPFVYYLVSVSNNIDALYSTDQNLGYFLKFFAYIAILISLMGIIAFSSFLASQRKKEIGIRKAIGASKSKILILLTNKFIKWITLSFIISCLLHSY